MNDNSAVSPNTITRTIPSTNNYFQFDFQALEFNAGGGSDVLQDFDFDSFLHNDGDQDPSFSFDSAFLDPTEIGAIE